MIDPSEMNIKPQKPTARRNPAGRLVTAVPAIDFLRIHPKTLSAGDAARLSMDRQGAPSTAHGPGVPSTCRHGPASAEIRSRSRSRSRSRGG
jgi:hypothetical protein